MKIKGLIAILICMVMLIGIIPLSVFADDCDHANAVFYEATSPTCFEPGCIAYWYCEDCYSFLDENKQYLIDEEFYWLREQDVIKDPATGHNFNKDEGVCINCGLANPVYTRVSSLDEVNEEDLYIFVAEVNGQHFVLGGLDESNPDEESNIRCPYGVGNAIPVVADDDGSISLVNQDILGDARPLEFMFDVNPDQWNWGQGEMGITVVMPLLPNYCVYPYQSHGYDDNGLMGVPRYAYGEYGKWDSSAWIIDFYTTKVNEDTYRDWEGHTHAEQLSWGVIGENVKEGDLLMYAQSYDSVGGAMFTLRLREFDDRYYFICGEDGFLEGVTQEVEYGPWDTNDVQYAISLYRYDVPAQGDTPPHNHVFVDGKCECGEEDPNYVPPHNHVFVDGKCECGEEDPNYVPPHNHVFVDGKCECGEEDPNYVPPHNHVFVDGKCECGEEDPNYVPPHNHVFVDGKCECGAEDPNYSAPHEHTYGEWQSDANNDMKHIRYCECGASESEDHAYGEWTKKDDNYHSHSCPSCGASEQIEHNYNDWIAKDDVEHIHQCMECDHNCVLPHDYEREVTKSPTFDEKGEATYTCSLCSHSYKEDIPKNVAEIVDETVDIVINIPSQSEAYIPDGTVIDVSEVPENEITDDIKGEIELKVDGSIKPLACYDLSLLFDGIEIQPDGNILVTLPALQQEYDYDSIVVVYIAPDGSVEKCDTTLNDDGTITFSTNHFSRYAVIGVSAENTLPPSGENDNDPSASPVVLIVILVIGIVIIGGVVVGPFFIQRKNKPVAEAADNDSDENDNESIAEESNATEELSDEEKNEE